MTAWNSGYLTESEFLQYAPEQRGDQVNVNHTGCTAGVDTKRRLYVKRNQDGSVVAYCHHCNRRGISRSNRAVFRAGTRMAHAGKYDSRKETGWPQHPDATHGKRLSYAYPSDANADTGQWPREARWWIERFGLEPKELALKGWAYSPYFNRVVIPVYDPVDGGMLGHQTRQLDSDDGYPKYMTFKNKDKCVERLYYSAMPRKTGTVVIVEDALSAEKVSKVADAVAVLTTTADNVLRDKLLASYSHVVIWLDDDNTDVKKKQQQLLTMFDPYVKVTVLHTSTDPKRHSMDQIVSLVGGLV